MISQPGKFLHSGMSDLYFSLGDVLKRGFTCEVINEW